MSTRDLNLSSRRENTRDVIVKVFGIIEIEKHFQESVRSIENKFSLALNLQKSGHNDEAMDVWRTQIVFLESAFDFYMHELVKLGIISIFNGEWNGGKSTKYKNLSFSMEYLEDALKDSTQDVWLKNWINAKYSSITMMSYDDLKKVCNLLELDISNIANEVFYEREDTVKTYEKLKTFMNDLYNRRNMIAHQSDRRMENAAQENIEEVTVKGYINSMKKIVTAIGNEMRKKLTA